MCVFVRRALCNGGEHASCARRGRVINNKCVHARSCAKVARRVVSASLSPHPCEPKRWGGKVDEMACGLRSENGVLDGRGVSRFAFLRLAFGGPVADHQHRNPEARRIETERERMETTDATRHVCRCRRYYGVCPFRCAPARQIGRGEQRASMASMRLMASE